MKIENKYRWFIIDADGSLSVPDPIKDDLDYRFLSGYFLTEKEAEDALIVYIGDDIYMGLEFTLVKSCYVSND